MDGGWLPGEPTLKRKVELEVLSPDFQGGQRGLEMNQLPMACEFINHTYVMKLP